MQYCVMIEKSTHEKTIFSQFEQELCVNYEHMYTILTEVMIRSALRKLIFILYLV